MSPAVHTHARTHADTHASGPRCRGRSHVCELASVGCAMAAAATAAAAPAALGRYIDIGANMTDAMFTGVYHG